MWAERSHSGCRAGKTTKEARLAAIVAVSVATAAIVVQDFGAGDREVLLQIAFAVEQCLVLVVPHKGMWWQDIAQGR